ncbi:MAG: HD domain-containing protein [Flavobacteriaceae bacterium]|jgi:tRNA nucleotidyltransferase/poly(A) polymerase|nr:HD domain-containing protein [Flavobacteriaceae bacterium]MBT7320991.1 HD domain-containing protein [Flavobacteriaceae bacterium]
MINNKITKAINNDIFKTIGKCGDELGIECYVIGGFVRDLLMNRKAPKDIDVLVIGDGVEMAKKVSKSLNSKEKVKVFKNFGTAMFKYNNTEIEFVGARKESYNHSSRKPIVESGTLDDDLDRRDFTINALGLGLNSKNWGILIDKFNGIDDLKNGIIKTPQDPIKTFSDDPLRMLRAIRFSCQLNFKIHEGSFKGIISEKDRIKIISGERISDELNKIIMTKKPSSGFKILDSTGILDILLPELTSLKGIDEIEGQKHKDNFYHTLEVLDNICNYTDNLWLRWAALMHDIGKAPTKKFIKEIGWTFHGHELKGSKMVFKIFKRLNMPLNNKVKYVQKIIFMSSRPIVLSNDNISDSAIRRLIYDAKDDVDDLLTLCEADITTKNPQRFRKYLNNFKKVRDKIIEVEKRDQIRNFQPPISGEEIMNYFNIPPGKEIGIIKSYIKDSILDGEIKNEYKSAKLLMIKKGTLLGLLTNEK